MRGRAITVELDGHDRRRRCPGQDRIYDGYPDIRLDLVESRTFDGGLQLLEYVPTGGK